MKIKVLQRQKYREKGL